MIYSWNAKFSEYFWNMWAIIYQCVFNLHDCTFFNSFLQKCSIVDLYRSKNTFLSPLYAKLVWLKYDTEHNRKTQQEKYGEVRKIWQWRNDDVLIFQLWLDPEPSEWWILAKYNIQQEIDVRYLKSDSFFTYS